MTSFQSYQSYQAMLIFHCFSDIDECATGTHNCSDHAVCNNNKGGYDCTCRKGFTGDGENCTGKIFALEAHVPRDFSISFELTSRIKLCFFSTVFQISMNVQQEQITAVIMPCVTTPREDTVVPARKVLLGME